MEFVLFYLTRIPSFHQLLPESPTPSLPSPGNMICFQMFLVGIGKKDVQTVSKEECFLPLGKKLTFTCSWVTYSIPDPFR